MKAPRNAWPCTCLFSVAARSTFPWAFRNTCNTSANRVTERSSLITFPLLRDHLFIPYPHGVCFKRIQTQTQTRPGCSAPRPAWKVIGIISGQPVGSDDLTCGGAHVRDRHRLTRVHSPGKPRTTCRPTLIRGGPRGTQSTSQKGSLQEYFGIFPCKYKRRLLILSNETSIKPPLTDPKDSQGFALEIYGKMPSSYS